MENNSIVRSRGCDFIFDEIIPEETTTEDGTPLKITPLTLRQSLFVKAFCRGLDVSKAAKEVGFSVSNGRKLVKSNPGVKRAIQIAIQNKMKTADLDAEWVLGNTREIVERSMELDEFNPALKGIEMIGKHFQMFNETININETKIIRIESNIDFEKILPKVVEV